MRRRIFLLGITLIPVLLMIGLAEAARSAEFSPTLSDEFNDPATLASWQALSTNATTAITIDIDTSTDNHLVMVPSNTRHTGQTGNNGWYANGRGPFIYKMVTGDFIVTSDIVAANVADLSSSPTGDFNSAGFVARDPASISGAENWIMFNHGYQTAGSNGLATEGKTTVNSSSILTLTTTDGINRGQLTLCRSGDTFYMYKLMDGTTDWVLDHTMVRPDLPETLQVGLVVNGWEAPDLYAQFDYVRFYTGAVATSAECLTQITTPTSISVRENSAEANFAPLLTISVVALLVGQLLLWKID